MKTKSIVEILDEDISSINNLMQQDLPRHHPDEQFLVDLRDRLLDIRLTLYPGDE